MYFQFRATSVKNEWSISLNLRHIENTVKNYLLYIFLNSGYFEKIQYKNLNEFIPRDLWSLAISSNKIAFVVSSSSKYEAKIWILAVFSKIIARNILHQFASVKCFLPESHFLRGFTTKHILLEYYTVITLYLTDLRFCS